MAGSGRRSEHRPKAPTEEITGVWPDRWWTAPTKDYVIATLKEGVKVKGPVPPDGSDPFFPGNTYRFFGDWQNHRVHGRTFHFLVYIEGLPHTRLAVVNYILRELKDEQCGIGHTRAHKLFDTYGPETVRIIRERPDEIADLLGIDRRKCYKASEILSNNSRFENTKIELVGLLGGFGFPKSTIRDIVTRWGLRAPALIRRDAFLLLTNRFKGAGFPRCDNLYLSLGGDPSRLKRQTLCAWHGLTKGGDGSTWHHPDVAVEAISSQVCGVDTNPKKALRLGIRSKLLAKHRDQNGQVWLAVGERSRNEQSVAESIARLSPNGSTPDWPTFVLSELSDHQQSAISAAIKSRIGILAGTPGTGKTYCAVPLIESVIDKYGYGSVATCAPTGKAAVRLTDQLSGYGLSARARTIHGLLGPSKTSDGDWAWRFKHNEHNPLPYRFLVVDESSMIDTDLMASLLRACKTGTHILFLGDPYQLPPVGHGAPLRDLLSSNISMGVLTEVRRNEGLIVDVCASIKSGVPWFGAKRFNADRDNLRVVGVSSSNAILNELQCLYKSLDRNKWDPIRDVQVIVPLNDKSDISREVINPFLQEVLNPEGQQGAGNQFKEGDKVICLSNGNYPSDTKNDATYYVCNGEQGIVFESADGHTTIEFPDIGEGCRLVRIPRKSEWEKEIDLAYAITAHKSQGSEWPIVVVIGDKHAGRVSSREWWYTAISRAKSRCLIFASLDLIGRQCKRVILGDRKTFLKERIAIAQADQAARVDHDQTPMDQQQERHDVASSEDAAEFTSEEIARRSDLMPVHDCD